MTTTSVPGLRELIAATVREVVTEMVGDSVRGALGSAPAATGTGSASVARSMPASASAPLPSSARSTGPESGRQRVERVRIGDDTDLDRFARHLLELFENPKNRQDLRAGRLRFSLAAGGTGTPGRAPAPRRIDTGAVTERHVRAAADAGESLLLGRRAVLTPLGREKARALGVAIEKER